MAQTPVMAAAAAKSATAARPRPRTATGSSATTRPASSWITRKTASPSRASAGRSSVKRRAYRIPSAVDPPLPLTVLADQRNDPGDPNDTPRS